MNVIRAKSQVYLSWNQTVRGLALVMTCTCLSVVPAEEPLQTRIADRHAEGTDLWVYNDLASAFAVAKRENRPIFVTFRCVPCANCEAFDAEVANGSDLVREFGRKNFVCVRQVEMKGVDLSQFQFDCDLNWAAMFLNADGTVYARYGTQSAAGPDAYNSIEGLTTTMGRVLELHANYPQNREELKDKRGAKKEYATGLEMPGLPNKDKYRGTTMRNNCIHCHNIHDAEYEHAVATNQVTRDMLWRFPLPDNVGLQIDPIHGRRISKVLDGSAAAQAGIKSGQEITHLNGQVITSIADMQWVLHHLPNTDATVRLRTADRQEVELKMMAGWKQTDISWRASMWSLRPRFPIWTPELTAEKKKELGLDPQAEAYEVRWINTGEAGGRAAKEAGLREGDVVTHLNGKPLSMKTPQFNLFLKLNYQVGDQVPLTLWRDGKPVPIEIPLVD